MIAEGSVDPTVSGKMYNRSVRTVKLTHQALHCMLFDKFIEDMKRKDVADFTQIGEDIHIFQQRFTRGRWMKL